MQKIPENKKDPNRHYWIDILVFLTAIGAAAFLIKKFIEL